MDVTFHSFFFKVKYSIYGQTISFLNGINHKFKISQPYDYHDLDYASIKR